ncbi:MAG TPA: zinc-ribbon domain-containing protein [Actinophytocola sp.]|uniref:zinc ribbon domain-containing protein n=1 Tax=Actinophytocola sp. TaxID=1872138 RepID=UPI002DDD9109|nr:zinc-ribbon domain-containing protein [Actinophytocola sp.]HEV2783970.1 zinc-ribbon domain-containing protein [Actinophytocola sp.]
MIVCTRCGTRNAADTEFCGNCGTFLEWQGAPAEEPALAQAAGPGVEQPAVPQPAVQQPTDERVHRRTTPTGTERRPPAPGDLICGECGAGNAPARKFCRHCGHSLAEAQTVERRWWQVLLPRRGTRKRHVGDRPRARGGRPWRAWARWVRRVVLTVLVLLAVLYAAVPDVRSEVNHRVLGARDWVKGVFVTKYDPIRPTSVTATAEVPDHGPNLAADNAKNTFWAAPATGGEVALVLTFHRPVDIRRAIVRIGNAADFQSAHRPAKLHLVYSTGQAFDVTLADTPEEQTVDIANSAGATTVEIHIVDLHRSLQGDTVAISEIELFEQVS